MTRAMRRSAASALAAALFSLGAQAAPAPEGASPLEAAGPGSGIDVGPLKFSAGPQADGGFGATLNGAGVRAFTPWIPASWLTLSPYVEFDVDAGFSSAADAVNNASVTLRPAIGTSFLSANDLGMEVPFLIVYAYLDARYRFGTIEEEGELKRANQGIYGGGLDFRFEGLYRWWEGALIDPIDFPRLTVGYYTVDETDTSAVSVPEEILADAIQASLQLGLQLRWQCRAGGASGAETCPLQLIAEAKGTRPTTGLDTKTQGFYDVALTYKTSEEVHPVLHYRSGTEQGLEYDRQIILGVLWELTPK
ncbi:MAG: hypothetical protein HYV18_00700 [Gammaproteobacteria bacterium]|nr:hypothetical protein [Gammaproteobacteria bacterium]